MKNMSGAAILIFIIFVVAAMFLKNRFFEFEGAADIGMMLFPKKGDDND